MPSVPILQQHDTLRCDENSGLSSATLQRTVGFQATQADGAELILAVALQEVAIAGLQSTNN